MKSLVLAAVATALLALSPVGASAAPINPTPLAAQDDAGITQAHYWGGGGGYGYGRRWYRPRHNYWQPRHHHRHYGFYPRFRSNYY